MGTWHCEAPRLSAALLSLLLLFSLSLFSLFASSYPPFLVAPASLFSGSLGISRLSTSSFLCPSPASLFSLSRSGFAQVVVSYENIFCKRAQTMPTLITAPSLVVALIRRYHMACPPMKRAKMPSPSFSCRPSSLFPVMVASLPEGVSSRIVSFHKKLTARCCRLAQRRLQAHRDRKCSSRRHRGRRGAHACFLGLLKRKSLARGLQFLKQKFAKIKARRGHV